ncbi:hypothetical protein EXU57_21725 [Segetibacter sp. 3557_3]|uniref:hypothetical protein n=1 Tax=Segetibacter sp. 3557_3 TaxID=2547429 RepID=UPI00105850B1|nr:hypothetical protein [Segetibacter sp. 3557_3]TDH20056.1 hypothetical protein EXU57_21725 [Segetibacter sp. 3557_3]
MITVKKLNRALMQVEIRVRVLSRATERAKRSNYDHEDVAASRKVYEAFVSANEKYVDLMKKFNNEELARKAAAEERPGG